MSFLELAKARYSCRRLTNAAIEPEKIERILQAAIAAPTAKNLQRYTIWKIQSPEAFDKLKQTTNYTFGAALAFVVGAKKDGAFDRPFDGKNFAEIDAAIVATHLMLAIQDEGKLKGLIQLGSAISTRRNLKNFSPKCKVMS